MWVLNLIQILEPSLRKRIQNHEHKIMYESDYLFWAPPRALEEALGSEGYLQAESVPALGYLVVWLIRY